MGQFNPEYVCGYVYGYDDKRYQKLDLFVQKNSDLFIKKYSIRNNYINYIMIWDGSKEFWDESDRANILREKFIRLLQESNANIYHIVDDEMDDQPRLFSHYDKYAQHSGVKVKQC